MGTTNRLLTLEWRDPLVALDLSSHTLSYGQPCDGPEATHGSCRSALMPGATNEWVNLRKFSTETPAKFDNTAKTIDSRTQTVVLQRE